MSSNTSNPIATVTNNSGFDVDMYDVSKPSTDPNTPGPLTYTQLATIPNGATKQVKTIRLASQVQTMLKGNIKALNGNVYKQFPVAVLADSPFADSNAFTITSDNQQSMVDSFKFIKQQEKRQKNAVNQFFQLTGSFKLCMITTWTAVFTWQAQFTNLWQGTYYLYNLGSSSTDNTSGSSAPALVATLAITATAGADSAVLTMAGTNNENTQVVMAGDGSMQEQNQGTGNISVALHPTWLNVAQTSQQNGKTVSNYVIGAATSDKSKNATDKNSANGFSLNSIEGLVGMLTSIGMLFYMAKGHKQAGTQRNNDAQKDATSKSDAVARESRVEADYQSNDVPLVKEMSQKVELTVPNVQQGYREVGQAQDIQVQQDAMREQANQLEEILEGGAPSQAVEDAAENLANARSELEKATDPTTTADARDAALTKVSTTLTETSTQIQTELQNEGNQLSEDEEKALKDTQEALDKAQEQAKTQEENQKEQEEQDEIDANEDVDDSQFDDPEPVDAPHFEGGE
ncbi:hypothetical protein CSAL01_04292 [Colletotrichum salicis]|uniref:Uncharacterized protein n=1 Tax=Colletotrichum salicis TaxID=1209931 RepID=A0A135UJZ1_9PEZI|nr:hypothetical protein CSAL01_04292 [Colletotrichum salicis]